MRRQASGGSALALCAAVLFVAIPALAPAQQGDPNAPLEAIADPPAHDANPPPMPPAPPVTHPPPTMPQHAGAPPAAGMPAPGAPAQAAPQGDAPRRLGRQFPTPIQPPAPSEPPEVHITVVPSSEPSVGRSRLRNGGGGGGNEGGGGGGADDGDGE